VTVTRFPVIDTIATGKNILALRKEKGLTVKDLQNFFGFEEPQAIYRWQYGKTLPSVDNLYALSAVLGVPMEQILVPVSNRTVLHIDVEKQQGSPAASALYDYSIKKLASVRLTSLSLVALPITRTISASSSLSQKVASWAAVRSSRYRSRDSSPWRWSMPAYQS